MIRLNFGDVPCGRKFFFNSDSTTHFGYKVSTGNWAHTPSGDPLSSLGLASEVWVEGDNESCVKPNYYRANLKGLDVDIIDVVQAFQLNFEAGNVYKYLARAGRKPGEEHIKDLKKAREYIDRMIENCERSAK